MRRRSGGGDARSVWGIPIVQPEALTDDHHMLCYHADTNSMELVALSGDVTGTHNVARVEAIQGKAVPLPTAADDGKVLAFNNTTGALEWVAVEGGTGVSGPVEVSNFPPIQPVSGTVNVGNFPQTQQVGGSVTAVDAPVDLCVSVTGAAGAAVTATLPAVLLQYHLISALQVVKYVTAAITGTATPIIVTTTNLPGNPQFTLARAGAIGTREVEQLELGLPLRSSAVNTPTTIVCPATASVLWRVTVVYRTSA